MGAAFDADARAARFFIISRKLRASRFHSLPQRMTGWHISAHTMSSLLPIYMSLAIAGHAYADAPTILSLSSRHAYNMHATRALSAFATNAYQIPLPHHSAFTIYFCL